MSSDPVNPQEALEKEGHAKCSNEHHAYEQCTVRLPEAQKHDSSKNCVGTYSLYWKCVDKHVAHHVFKKKIEIKTPNA